jgi:hypothetical protein
MKRILFTLAQICLLVTVSANNVRAQNHTQVLSVTNSPLTISADGNYNQVLVRENSATPTAVFSITLAGSATAINYPAGTQFLFSGNFSNGQVLGTIVATTSGPFTFIAVEASGPGQGFLNWNTSSASVSTVIDASNSSTINLATSSSQTIALAATFQTASASNTITVNMFKAVRQN